MKTLFPETSYQDFFSSTFFTDAGVGLFFSSSTVIFTDTGKSKMVSRRLVSNPGYGQLILNRFCPGFPVDLFKQMFLPFLRLGGRPVVFLNELSADLVYEVLENLERRFVCFYSREVCK